jgi:hypothetical protein
MHTGFWWESQKERDYYEDLDVGGRMIILWHIGPLLGNNSGTYNETPAIARQLSARNNGSILSGPLRGYITQGTKLS